MKIKCLIQPFVVPFPCVYMMLLSLPLFGWAGLLCVTLPFSFCLRNVWAHLWCSCHGKFQDESSAEASIHAWLDPKSRHSGIPASCRISGLVDGRSCIEWSTAVTIYTGYPYHLKLKVFPQQRGGNGIQEPGEFNILKVLKTFTTIAGSVIVLTE